MEPLWSPPDATGGNQWQWDRAENRDPLDRLSALLVGQRGAVAGADRLQGREALQGPVSIAPLLLSTPGRSG